MKFLIILVVAVGIPSIYGFSKGAPDSQCDSMTPKHGPVQPQKSAAPYDIILSKKSVRAGEKIDITIKGKAKENVIKGLLVQARVGETAIGAFDVNQSRSYIQNLNCGSGKNVRELFWVLKTKFYWWICFFQNAVTHKKIEQDINEVKFSWTAPKGLSEKVTFLATIAQNGGVFWVKVPSAVVSVSP